MEHAARIEPLAGEGRFDQEQLRIDRLPGLEGIFLRFCASLESSVAELTRCACHVELGEVVFDGPIDETELTGSDLAKLFEFPSVRGNGALLFPHAFVRLVCDAAFQSAAERVRAVATRPPTRVETVLIANMAEELVCGFIPVLLGVEIEAISESRLRNIDHALKKLFLQSQMVAATLRIDLGASAASDKILMPIEIIRSARRALSEPIDRSPATPDGQRSAEMVRCINSIAIPVIAVIDQLPLPIEKVMKLAIGDIVPLRTAEIETISLVARGRQLGRYVLEHDGRRYALRPIEAGPKIIPVRERDAMNVGPPQHVEYPREAQMMDRHDTPDEKPLKVVERGGGLEKSEMVLAIPITIQIVLGSATMSVSNLMALNRDSIIELDQRVGDPVSILANGCLIGKGEIVLLDEDRSRYGVALTEVVPASASERLT
jgi:flagellar motor switch protein FliN/FliY